MQGRYIYKSGKLKDGIAHELPLGHFSAITVEKHTFVKLAI